MEDSVMSHTPEPRCSECRWIHEADSVLGTSFMGVGLCPLHAAAPALREALASLIAAEDRFVSESAVPLNDAVSEAVEQARAILKEIKP
jgi:hypothetical protein